MNDNDPRKHATTFALRRISVREHCSSELLRYLARKGVESVTAEAVVAELISQKLIDDSRYARIVTREQALRGKGPAYILQKLRQKGLHLELSDVKRLYGEVAETSDVDAARRVVERRYPGYRDDKSAAQRAFQTLLRRGFSFETARKVIGGRSDQR